MAEGSARSRWLRRPRLAEVIGWIVALVAALITRTVIVQSRTKDQSYDLLRDELAAKNETITRLTEQVRSASDALTNQRTESNQLKIDLAVCQGKGVAAEPPPSQPQNAAVVAGPAIKPQSARPPATTAKYASGVEFDAPACSQRADRVRCKFRIVNLNEKSQKLGLEITNISQSSWFTYLVDANGLKYFARDSEIGGVEQAIWGSETLDPSVPVVAALIFETPQAIKFPIAISMTVRIQAAGDPNIGNPQVVFFKDIAVE